MPESRQNAAIGFVIEEAKKWLARTLIAASAATLVFFLTPLRAHLSEIWDSPQRLADISAKLDTLTVEVQRATGEDRVVWEAPGLSYVQEPVYEGDQITLSMVVRRTRLGATCTLMTRTPVFADDTGISIVGPTSRPPRQLTTAETQVKLMLDIPSQIQPGRVTVYLSMEFDCSGKAVFDTTRPVPFALLPAQ